jgi:hypothetical protein
MISIHDNTARNVPDFITNAPNIGNNSTKMY